MQVTYKGGRSKVRIHLTSPHLARFCSYPFSSRAQHPLRLFTSETIDSQSTVRRRLPQRITTDKPKRSKLLLFPIPALIEADSCKVPQ